LGGAVHTIIARSHRASTDARRYGDVAIQRS
jgi:hypothetical protein